MGGLVVLSYSGGLDTSAIVPWLRETYDARVLCFTADVGQGSVDLAGLEQKAMRSGAVGCVVEDLRERFVTDYVFPTLRAGAVYARSYLLGTAMARPVIAAGQVETARAAGATVLAHGCTGKGNDQVRFELTYQALAPAMDVIAPWREWSFRGRADLIAYLREKGMPVDQSEEKLYSRDRNLWHCSHEGGILEDPAMAPPEDLFQITSDPTRAPADPDDVTIGFEEGVPVSIDGAPLGSVALVEHLNDLAGFHGIGRADLIEDRLVGMKSRGVYETPGGTVLRQAHRELEQLVLDRRVLALKDQLAPRYADLVYEGRWWTPEREALDALVDVTQRHVTGSIRLRLCRGNATVIARESPFSIYDPKYATFGADDVYSHADAAGFIRLFGLPMRVETAVKGANVGALSA
ncbi:MAG: argininosuccinate synthase [Gemmatimonadetes bacterium]|nr:argininosuccinate synthase [Gemmatimonadota bacterium]